MDKIRASWNFGGEFVGKMREKVRKFRREFRKQIVLATIAAFGFLIALTWRDFISEIVGYFVKSLGLPSPLYIYKLMTALIITFLAVLGILIITKFKVEVE